MITVLDINNFWSPSGGGVRRYHLERMAHYRNQTEFKIVFLMQDSTTYTEEISPGLIIEHVKAFKIPGNWEYRFIWKPWIVRKYVKKYMPDLMEIGSPYWLPIIARWATWGLKKDIQLLGFWHADFPVTYVRRGFAHLHPLLGRAAETVAWWYARWAYANYRVVQASSCEIMARMISRKVDRVHWIPLGVDVQLFSPAKKDPALVSQLKQGMDNRLTLFFPHRLTEEKGVHLLLGAYPILCELLGYEPSVTIASVGPFKAEVEAAALKYPMVRYIGFVKGTEEMARWYASTEIGLALSPWETFGLSILESMASGQVLIGATAGAAKEHIETAGSGLLLENTTPQGLANALFALSKRTDFKELQTKSRAYAEEFTWETSFTRQKNLYRKLLTPQPESP